MCGLTGLVDFSRTTPAPELDDLIRRMNAALVHRGPDSEGICVEAASGIALGHRRLAIVDLSPLGAQPMTSADGRYTVVFNGEIYDHRAHRARLERLGHVFTGTSDTEVLLAGIVEWGLEASLAEFDAMFAMAVWDRSERRIHLARDRFGEKPLLWSHMGNTLVFGSELGALMAHPDLPRRVNRTVLARYLMANCVPGREAMVAGVERVPPGSIVTIDLDRASVADPAIWWCPVEAAVAAVSDPLDLSVDTAADEVERLLGASVGVRMVADVPLGAFLSGGLDSSLVVALMAERASRPVKTFTIGFDSAAHDESAHAKAVASHLGTEHTELILGPDEIRSVVPRLAAMFDEPFADSSQIPTHLVAAMARRDVTVALSGDAGDELFAGYNRYRYVPAIWNRLGSLPLAGRSLTARGIHRVPPRAWDRAAGLLPDRIRPQIPANKARKLGRILDAGSPQEIYKRLITHWDDAARIVRGSGGAEEVTNGWLAHETERWPELDGLVRQMQVVDTATYLVDDILTKVDRAAMAVSLETRVPFLNKELYEFAHRVPTSLHTAHNQPKHLLKRVLARHVPPELTDRPKSGFSVPIGDWLRGDLRQWANDLLDRDRLTAEGFFDPEPICALHAEHLAGRVDAEHELWDICMFQAWHEHWIE